ncbi:MAG: hypothetical protein IKT33_03020 [Clostridia bacterium]|nr:hypothetical protein [Clostridia bacterium]
MLRRKLIFNLVVLAVCGAIALTIPVIANHFKKKPTAATSNNNNPNSYKLTSYFVGDQKPLSDVHLVWQLCLTDNYNHVVANWEEIYKDTSHNFTLAYDTKCLNLTASGLVYQGILNQIDYESLYTEGFRSTVTYKGFTCEICLP